VQVGVGGCGDAGQASQERVGRGVEELVGDAEDSALTDSFEGLPAALLDDAVEGNAIPCSAPGEEEDVRVGGCDLFGGGVVAGGAEIVAAGGFDEFGDPGLGVDERLAPLFTVDDGRVSAGFAASARGFDGGLHFGDERFGFGLRVDVRGDEADVLVDVGEGMRREG
jgi:hypothetical protein